MRPTRLAGLILAFAVMMPAQVGTVQNAAILQPTGTQLFGYVVPNGYLSLILDFSAISENIVSPRMLAVLSYPSQVSTAIIGLLPAAAPVAATLFIRPVGSNTAIPVTVTNAVAGAITFVVPAGVPVGGAELLYQVDGQATQWTTVNVVQASFEFFSPAQAVSPNGSIGNVGLATPAQPSQTLLLTGSGLGYGSTVSATIGGVAAPLIYAGAHPTQAGRDEILLQIPSTVSDGCYVPVVVTCNQTTVTTTISKTSDGSPCKHPWQLSVNDMKTLDSGGTLTDGVVNLSTQINAVTSTVASRNESANMSVSQITAEGIAVYFAQVPVTSSPSCTALASAGGFAAFNGAFSVLQPGPPDLGASVALQSPTTAITLDGSSGRYSATLPPPTDGSLSNLPAPAIAGGKWTWQSSGGKDLSAASFGFTLPAPIELNGGAPISLRRDQDQVITWNGAAFDAGATVNVNLSGAAAVVNCAIPATSGAATIPALLLSAYAASSIGTLTVSLNESGFFLPHAQFQLEDGATLLMFVSFSSGDSRPVAFQ
jgi:uncharacterized protein (TIGR03437 family)